MPIFNHSGWEMWPIWPVKIAKFEKNGYFTISHNWCTLKQKVASKGSNIFAALWGVTKLAFSSRGKEK